MVAHGKGKAFYNFPLKFLPVTLPVTLPVDSILLPLFSYQLLSGGSEFWFIGWPIWGGLRIIILPSLPGMTLGSRNLVLLLCADSSKHNIRMYIQKLQPMGWNEGDKA